jgi:hypothetical protein
LGKRLTRGAALGAVSQSPLLWIDCTAGAVVGLLVIALSEWLSGLEGLPRAILLFTGVANLIYASYSFSLAVRSKRPMLSITLLVFANLAWVPVCLGLLVAFSGSVTTFGVAHLVGEAAFVGGLAVAEWRAGTTRIAVVCGTSKEGVVQTDPLVNVDRGRFCSSPEVGGRSRRIQDAIRRRTENGEGR